MIWKLALIFKKVIWNLDFSLNNDKYPLNENVTKSQRKKDQILGWYQEGKGKDWQKAERKRAGLRSPEKGSP